MTLSKKLTNEDNEALAQMVLEVHQRDPGRLRKALPEVADLLEALITQAPVRGGPQSPFGLTERERNFHKEALEELLNKFKYLTPEQAIKGLEHGAALLDDNSAYFELRYSPRQELLRLVRKATGIQPRKTGKPVEKVVRKGESSRTVPVVRGVDLHLTWGFKLVKVTMDPHQWRLRSQALRFVGMGRDIATDVAENHDDYVVDAYLNG